MDNYILAMVVKEIKINVHMSDENGKFVITMSTADGKAIGETIQYFGSDEVLYISFMSDMTLICLVQDFQ